MRGAGMSETRLELHQSRERFAARVAELEDQLADAQHDQVRRGRREVELEAQIECLKDERRAYVKDGLDRERELEAEVERLREVARKAWAISDGHKAEVEKLRREKRHVEAAFDQLDGIKGRAERAEADRDRLAEALEELREKTGDSEHHALIRAALEGSAE